MVILPTEKRFDWKYAPVMLFAIVTANVLIFLLYQSGDSSKFERAYETYYQAELFSKEWPAYQHYLAQQNEGELLSYYQEQFDEEYVNEIIVAMMIDDEFYRYIETHSERLELDPYDITDTWENWRRSRARVDEIYRSISSTQFGLIPNELSPSSPLTLFTHQFLHGNFMHLLGNMFFLVICGFAVEAAIGAWLFLALYVISGVFGGLMFALMDLSGTQPLVGASGAISGVMAMYLGIFRLRKIEFFYWIFVFAGYFRAPALLILPIYIGKELTDLYLHPDSNVAFLAHAGGFISGGLLVGILYKIKPALINQDYVEEDQQIDPQQEARARIYEQFDTGQLAKALALIEQFSKEYVLDFDLALLAFRLSELLGQESSDEHFKAFLKHRPVGEKQLDQLANVCREHPELMFSLSPKYAVKIALTLTIPKHINMAEVLFTRLYEANPQTHSLDILARKLSITYEKLREPEKQRYFGELADRFVGGAF